MNEYERIRLEIPRMGDEELRSTFQVLWFETGHLVREEDPGYAHCLRAVIRASVEISEAEVDRMVDSAIKSVPAKRLRGIQLTGIGNDGARAMTELHKLGSQVIAESKESSVVFGMPGNLISMGGAGKVLHHRDIAKAMLATVQR